jgi:hypothetical protein
MRSRLEAVVTVHVNLALHDEPSVFVELTSAFLFVALDTVRVVGVSTDTRSFAFLEATVG